MLERLIISGFGGQGVMFLGRLIAWAAMLENKFVTFLPAYGAEVRGGTSHCSVIISGKEIASPQLDTLDSLIAMNKPSLVKFISWVESGGYALVNSSMIDEPPRVKGVRLHLIPFTGLASDLGNIRTANMIALGAYLVARKVLSPDSILKLLPEAFKNNPALVHLNEKAIYVGMKMVKE